MKDEPDSEGMLSPTLAKMQRLNDGFHELADVLLRYAYPDLRSLRPHGINKEGKPIGGVPDSYVGTSPSDCRIAVEYTTTQANALSSKFVKDYDNVVQRCPSVKRVVLCTNRPKSSGVADAVLAKAKAQKKRIQVIWGEDLVRILDEQRQDLRKKHLGIPLVSINRDSLVPALQDQLTRSLLAHFGQAEVAKLAQRIRRLPMEAQFSRLRPAARTGITLVTGEAGLGKTSWSMATAVRLSQIVPVVWIRAQSIGSGGMNLALVSAIFGTDEQERVHELAQVLRASGRKLVAFVDGIDEHSDYQFLQESLRNFEATSPLGPECHLVLTCRNEALQAFENVEPNVLPPAARGEDGRHLRLGPLPEEHSKQLLQRLGANTHEIAKIKSELPKTLFGNPLYLGLSHQLARAGVPLEARNWIERFADQFLRDIRARLRSNPPIGTKKLSTSFEALAVPALRALQGLEEERAIALLPQSSSIGPEIFIERAIQSGLLVQSDGRLRFCHALFAELFAGRAIASDRSRSLHEIVELIQSLPGRESVSGFAVRLMPELLAQLAKERPQLVPEFCHQEMNEESQQELSKRGVALLSSLYPSERWAGVRIMSSLGLIVGGRAAVDWFNGLEPQVRRERLWEASELFLKLQLPGAAIVAAVHRDFMLAGQSAWYFPERKAELESSSAAFKTALANIALSGLESESLHPDEQARYVAVLTYLADNRLLERLREKAEKGPLAHFEHRSLMMFNNEVAMGVYLRSRDHYFAYLDEDDDQEPAQGERRAAVWRSLVPRQGDVVMFQHEFLVHLAQRSLEEEGERNVRFGMELAEVLCHPDLVDGYARAVSRLGCMFTRKMISKLVLGSTGVDILALYNSCTSKEARKEILKAAGDVPGAEVECLLVDALANDELFEAACAGLAKLRSSSGAAELHRRLRSLSGYSANLACKVLARCAYEPALPDLIGMLNVAQQRSEQDRWLSEYDLLCFVGEIGGRAAFDALAASAGRMMDEKILSYLLDSHDEYAFELVHGILSKFPASKYLLGWAIEQRDHLREDVVYFSAGPVPFEFSDSAILAALLDSANEHLEKAEESELMRLEFRCDYQAVALFNLPEAESFLRKLAERDLSASNREIGEAIRFARDTLGQRGDKKMAKLSIQELLRSLTGRERPSPWDVEKFQFWPRELVRQCLLEALQFEPGHKDKWLFLLSWFSSEQDSGLFRKHLDDLSPELADEISQNLPYN